MHFSCGRCKPPPGHSPETMQCAGAGTGSPGLATPVPRRSGYGTAAAVRTRPGTGDTRPSLYAWPRTVHSSLQQSAHQCLRAGPLRQQCGSSAGDAPQYWCPHCGIDAMSQGAICSRHMAQVRLSRKWWQPCASCPAGAAASEPHGSVAGPAAQGSWWSSIQAPAAAEAGLRSPSLSLSVQGHSTPPAPATTPLDESRCLPPRREHSSTAARC